METSLVFQSHPTEVTWEEYAFGRLSEKKALPLEEHLLGCELCQAYLEEVTEYIQLMKAGLKKMRMADLTRAATDGFARPGRLIGPAVARHAGLMWATALAAGCMAVWFSLRAAPSAATGPFMAQVTSAQVLLASFRSGVNVARGPARRPLDLHIDMADVPAATEYRLEVVTASGKPVWNSAPDFSSGKLSVHLPHGLEAGLYWVRLYARNSEILSEFGLLVE